jgi:hypothetical protein
VQFSSARNVQFSSAVDTESAVFSKIQIAAPRAIGQYDRMIRHHRGAALSERLGIPKAASGHSLLEHRHDEDAL